MFECLNIPLMFLSPIIVGWSLQLAESLFTFLSDKFESVRKVEVEYGFNTMSQIPYVMASVVLTYMTSIYHIGIDNEPLISSYANPETGWANGLLTFYVRIYLWLATINIVVWFIRKNRYWSIPIILGLGVLIMLFMKYIFP